MHEMMGWGQYLTHRQFVLWQVWLDEQMNIPSRDNYYQMQIAAEVQKTRVKNTGKIKVDGFKLTFSEKTQGKNDLSNPDMHDPETRKRIEETKRRVFGFMTAPITVRVDGEEKDTIVPPQVKRQELLRKIAERRQANKSKADTTKKDQPNGRSDTGRTRRTRGQIPEDA